MSRPTTKEALLKAATDNYQKLWNLINDATEIELSTPFDFANDEKKKEAHWKRDQNLRDVLIHLYEWHQLLRKWVDSNLKGTAATFIPAPYNWKTYGEMNVGFWKKHQNTSLEEAKAMLEESHHAILELAMSFSDAELFTKGQFQWAGNNALGSYFVSTTSAHYDWAMKKWKAHQKVLKQKAVSTS